MSSDAVASTELVEASGVVASRDHAGVLWSHNDSGGNAELFALGLDGSDLGRLELAGAQAVDWEDIALLPGADGSPDLLFAADIGDNFGRGTRTEPVRVYRVAEPAAPGTSVTATAPATAFDLTYADGARDAETLLADPLTGDLFVVSKQWDGADAGVYRIPADVVAAPTAPAAPVPMARVGTAAGTAA